MERHGRTADAIQATIDQCVQEGVMVEYFEERRKEVMNIMTHTMAQEHAVLTYVRGNRKKLRKRPQKKLRKRRQSCRLRRQENATVPMMQRSLTMWRRK